MSINFECSGKEYTMTIAPKDNIRDESTPSWFTKYSPERQLEIYNEICQYLTEYEN